MFSQHRAHGDVNGTAAGIRADHLAFEVLDFVDSAVFADKIFLRVISRHAVLEFVGDDADLSKPMVSFPPSFAGLAHEMASFSSRAKIVKGPTDFGKRVENGPIAVRLWLKARADARLLLGAKRTSRVTVPQCAGVSSRLSITEGSRRLTASPRAFSSRSQMRRMTM